MEKNHYYAFFSQVAVSRGASILLYDTPHGRQIEVTFISRDKNGAGYDYDDKIFMGKVTTFVRTIKMSDVFVPFNGNSE